MGSPEPTFEISYHRSSVGHLSIRLSVYLVVCFLPSPNPLGQFEPILAKASWVQIFFYLIGGYTVYIPLWQRTNVHCVHQHYLSCRTIKNNWNQNFWHFHIYLVEGIIKSCSKMEVDDLLMSETQEKGTSYETWQYFCDQIIYRLISSQIRFLIRSSCCTFRWFSVLYKRTSKYLTWERWGTFKKHLLKVLQLSLAITIVYNVYT